MTLGDFHLASANASGGISQPNRWRAEWTATPALQERYSSADAYAEDMARQQRDRSEAAPSTAMSTAEAQRRAEIDEMALPGHEALIAELKADPSVTPGAAALRIIEAEKALRVPAKATAAVLPFRRHASTTEMKAEMDNWRTDWRNDAALQREFSDADAYASYRWAVATGRTRGPSDAA